MQRSYSDGLVSDKQISPSNVLAVEKPIIALVAASLNILGGHGVQAVELMQRLKDENYDVRFIPINPVFPYGFKWLRRIPYLRTLFNQVLYLMSLVALRKVDVVHVFSASYWSFLLAPVPAMLIASLLGKRIILHYHSGEAEDHLMNWGMFVHPGLRLAHEIVVPSAYLQDVFSRYGYQARVIRNVVDLTRFRFRERSPLQPKLLSVRNLERHYRVDIVLHAFSLVKSVYPDATLTIAGVGSLDRNLRNLAEELVGMNGVYFVGRVEPRDMPDLYNKADIFVNASVIDNQPVSVLEAFAAGLPVVTTPTGDIMAMVRDQESGLLIRQESPAAMANAVIALLHNADQAKRITQQAREAAAQYTWPEVRHAWAAVYENKPGPSCPALS